MSKSEAMKAAESYGRYLAGEGPVTLANRNGKAEFEWEYASAFDGFQLVSANGAVQVRNVDGGGVEAYAVGLDFKDYRGPRDDAVANPGDTPEAAIEKVRSAIHIAASLHIDSTLREHMDAEEDDATGMVWDEDAEAWIPDIAELAEVARAGLGVLEIGGDKLRLLEHRYAEVWAEYSYETGELCIASHDEGEALQTTDFYAAAIAAETANTFIQSTSFVDGGTVLKRESIGFVGSRMVTWTVCPHGDVEVMFSTLLGARTVWAMPFENGDEIQEEPFQFTLDECLDEGFITGFYKSLRGQE